MTPQSVIESCGSEANVTEDTAPWNIWCHHVETCSIRLGVSPEFLHGRDIHARVRRAYVAGESVWMVVHELLARHYERHPTRSHIRDAIRACEEARGRRP